MSTSEDQPAGWEELRWVQVHCSSDTEHSYDVFTLLNVTECACFFTGPKAETSSKPEPQGLFPM